MKKRDRLPSLNPLDWRQSFFLQFSLCRLEIWIASRTKGYSEIELSLTSSLYDQFLKKVRSRKEQDCLEELPEISQNLVKEIEHITIASASFGICDSRMSQDSVCSGEILYAEKVIGDGCAYVDEGRFLSFLYLLSDKLKEPQNSFDAFLPNGLVADNFWMPDSLYAALFFANLKEANISIAIGKYLGPEKSGGVEEELGALLDSS